MSLKHLSCFNTGHSWNFVVINSELRSKFEELESLCAGPYFDVNCMKLHSRHLKNKKI